MGWKWRRRFRIAARERQNGKCYYCGKVMAKFRTPEAKEFPMLAETIDHKRPRGKGGTNDWDNMALACRGCNVMKGSQMEWEFLAKIRRATTTTDREG